MRPIENILRDLSRYRTINDSDIDYFVQQIQKLIPSKLEPTFTLEVKDCNNIEDLVGTMADAIHTVVCFANTIKARGIFYEQDHYKIQCNPLREV